MQCEDNSKLRTPLHEVCFSPDIGCVPIVDGKPDCEPMPDELPFAFDPRTTTLWLFNCRTREWIPFQKFRLCNDLVEVNLENLNNICDILRIPVFFNSGNGCQEGWITLQELVEQIKKCLHLKWQALCVDVDTLKISIKGLEGSLPPWYVRFENLWPVCGKGTEDDPVVIQTYDPLCKWPTKTVDDIYDARVKHLGACLDDKMVRVPFPPRPCEFPQLTEEQVAAVPRPERELIACVQGEEAKVPYPPMPCEFPQYTQSQVEQGRDVDVIFCVDGNNVKVPIPSNFFGPRPCEFPQYVRSQVEAGQDVDIIFCIDGKDVKVPIPPAFFTPEYLCVPEVVDKPTAPPAEGTGPLRVDCNGTIWIWVCETQMWVAFHTGPVETNIADVKTIVNPCEDIEFKSWYKGTNNICLEPAMMNLDQLSNFVFDCSEYNGRIEKIFTKYGGVEFYTAGSSSSGDGHFKYQAPSSGNLIVRGRDGSIVKGADKGAAHLDSDIWGGSPHVTITNDTNRFKFYMILHVVRLNRPSALSNTCHIGVKTALTGVPALGTVDTNSQNYIRKINSSDQFPDQIVQDCSGDNLYAVGKGCRSTPEVDLWNSNIRNQNRRYCVGNLYRGNNIVTVRSAKNPSSKRGNLQQDYTMQFTNLFLAPGETVTIYQEALITVSDIQDRSQPIYMTGNHRFFVIGFNHMNILNDDTPYEDDTDSSFDDDDN